MNLSAAPLLYVFYEIASLSHQRELCERILGLPVIEDQFHPPHEYHGLVKYDAGQVILSLNLSNVVRFQKNASDGLVTVLSVENEISMQDLLRHYGYATSQQSGRLVTDAYGHHYLFCRSSLDSASQNPAMHPAVQELRLTVSDFNLSLPFYRDILGLKLLDQADSSARFATGTADILIQHSQTAPDGRPVRHDTYLMVFYTENIFAMKDALIERGLVFRGRGVGLSDIGHTARFEDPSGHIYCLYQPSEECLTWGSGPKVLEIVANIEAGETR